MAGKVEAKSLAEMTFSAQTLRVGNTLADRVTPDNAATIQFVDTDLYFFKVGRVTAWDIFTGRAGTQSMQVWRPACAHTPGTRAAGCTEWTLVCENELTVRSSPVKRLTLHACISQRG